MDFSIYWHGIEIRKYDNQDDAKEVFEWFKTFLCERFLELK